MTPQALTQNNNAATAPTFLTRAIALIDRGFSVIPIEARGKRPAGPGATSRTRNLEIIKVWAECWPDANVAVCADENVTILESDDAAKFHSILAGLGVALPETLTGGASENRPHWFYKRTPACGNECLEVPGIFEFRNANQYVVGPGSIHPSGAAYRFWNNAPIAELPDAVIDALRQLDAGYKGEAKSEHIQPGPYTALREAYLRHRDPADLLTIEGLEVGEGERHYTLVSLAGLLHDGERSAEDIAEILRDVRDNYFEDGKGDEEVERIAEDMSRREPCRPSLPSYSIGTKVFTSLDAYLAYVRENADRLTLAAPITKNDGARRLRLMSFAGMQSKVVDWYWPGRLARGHITTFNGDPGTMKSFASVDLAARVTTGRAFPDGEKNPLPASSVLVLTREDGLEDTVKPRFLAAGGNPKFLHTITLEGSSETAVVKIEEHLGELDAILPKDTRLIIFDPLIDFLKAGQNDEQAVRDTLTQLKQFAEQRNLAIIGINHLNKKSDLEAIHRAMGAKGMIGVARMNYLFGKDEQGTRHMVTLKNNVWHEDGSLTFHVEDSTVEDGGLVITKIGRIAWDGKGAVTADELSSPKKKAAIDVVGDWLKEMLMPIGTKRPSDELYAAGQERGISEDQIKRGLKRLNATYERTKTVPPKTIWFFPEVGW